MTADSEAMAKAKALWHSSVPVENGKKKVVWNGKALQIMNDGDELDRTAKFTYQCGYKMVGYIEVPTTASTKLIHGEYRAINTRAPTKEGCNWKPGCRYSNRVCPSSSCTFVLDLRVLLGHCELLQPASDFFASSALNRAVQAVECKDG
jgi:hypothetical protein